MWWRLLGAAGMILTLALVAAVLAGGMLSSPALHSVGDPPADLPWSALRIARPGSAPLAGWILGGNPDAAGVLLLHGIRSDRRQMLGRARFLHAAGYTVLLVDLPGHGESAGARITFGYREAAGARAAFQYLREQLKGRPLGVIGVSLGGAAALLGEAPLDADALILESVYSDVEQATKNRMRLHFGVFGEYLAPLLTLQIEPRLGIPVEALSPLAAAARVRHPLFLLSGTQDQHTRGWETRAVYAAAGVSKQLWLVEGAAHEDLHQYAPVEYERRVLEFFARYLGAGANP